MKFTPLALAGAIALTAAGASFAQPAPQPGGPQPAEGRGWQRPDPAQMAERRAEHLRAVLQLRPEQEPALRALIAALQPDPAKMEQRRQERGEMRNLTTPQRLDRAQARMAERQAAFTRRAEAVRKFYAQLTPAQQKAFDALHEGHGGMRGMHRGHGGFGHGGFGPGRG
jgi:Spy/CpxP family protein refolding chaperone